MNAPVEGKSKTQSARGLALLHGLPVWLCLLIAWPALAGPLRVGVSGDYPPFCAPADTGGYAGFDMTLLQNLTPVLQRSGLETVRFIWPGLSALMQSGQVDVAVCGITVRRDRALAMAFTRPYAVSGAVAVVRVDDGARFPDLAAVDRPGVRIAVNAGGHLERVARVRFRRAAIHTTHDNLALRAELDRGTADVVISDSIEAAHWRQVRLLGPFTRDRKALALPLDHMALRDRINTWLAAREADGWLASQRRRFGFGAYSPAQACADSLADSITLRLALMPQVAAVKRRDHVPITDAAQEQAVLARAAAAGAALGLRASATTRLFRELIADAKRIENRAAEPPVPGVTLAHLRGAIAAAGGALLPEIGRCESVLQGRETLLRETLRDATTGQLHPDELEALLAALPPRANFRDDGQSDDR